MGETSIEWTDKTWNPVTGCTKVSPGCKYCYAERVFPRAYSNCDVCGHPGPAHNLPNGRCSQCPDGRRLECDGFVERQFTDVRTHQDRLDQPLHWRKPARIFVNSMSDLFHEGVSEEFITRVFSVMAATDWHQFQILTKRPLRMFRYIESHKQALSKMAEVWPIPNIWLGVSVENQQYADERIPLLLQTPAAVRFVSYEPALGPVDFTRYLPWVIRQGRHEGHYPDITLPSAVDGAPPIDWLICGGESGPGARPFNIQWARDVVAQCKAAGAACFVKQLGAKPVDRMDEHSYGYDIAWRSLIKDRKGGTMSEWPEDLRVREFPGVMVGTATLLLLSRVGRSRGEAGGIIDKSRAVRMAACRN